MNKYYYSLISMINQHLRIRTLFIIVEEFIVKYIWGLLGYFLCAAPIFLGELGDIGDNIGSLVSSRTKGKLNIFIFRFCY